MASINLQGDTSGAITISAPSVAGTNTLTLPATTQTLATQNALGVRNLIINGDMRIDQRNAGASVTPSNSYTLDRWTFATSVASKFTAQQSTTATDTFKNSLLITSSSAYSVGSSDILALQQKIEGFNIAHLNWGTASAKKVTLSFWVRSSLTGTFGGSISNSGYTRSYPFSYTISSADTWEKITITIDGDTAGSWASDNSTGMRVIFGIGVGSTYSGTAGAWASSELYSVTGATSVVGTNGATFYITGVQLEIGDTATPFEHRPYDMELARCQRYYWKLLNNSSAYWYSAIPVGAFNATRAFTSIILPCPMRSTPTISTNNANIRDAAFVNSWSVTAVTNYATTSQFTNPYTSVEINVASGMTAGSIYFFTLDNSGTAYLQLSAEL